MINININETNIRRVGLLPCQMSSQNSGVRQKTQNCDASGYKDTEGSEERKKEVQVEDISSELLCHLTRVQT